jgi:L-lactate dehydrogenase complex protein LldE
VHLLVTCLIDRVFPETGEAVVRVLERLGLEVDVPPAQTCCGQPAFNGGDLTGARALARYTIDLLDRTTDPIVIPSGSCGDMVKHHYAELFRDDPVYGPKVQRLEHRVFEFTEFLVRVLGVTDVGAVGTGTYTYHACCHGLRNLGLDAEPRALLAGVHGARVCPLEEDRVCCGFGGLFAVKMSELSAAMLSRKLDCIEASGADTVVVTDVSCGMHMAGGLRRRPRGRTIRVRHVADVLAAGDEPGR